MANIVEIINELPIDGSILTKRPFALEEYFLQHFINNGNGYFALGTSKPYPNEDYYSPDERDHIL